MAIKIKIPTSLADITLGQYKRYEKILDTNKNDEISERFVNLKMLEIFCNITYQEATALKLIDYDYLIKQIHNTLKEQPPLVLRFKMGDTEFGFIPDLEEMTFGEYIDLDTNIHDITNIEKAMAVLYRPIKYKKGKKYVIDQYKGDLFHDAMLNMPMSAVVSSIVFFLQFRDRIVERYDEIFGQGGSNTTATAGFGNKWGLVPIFIRPL